MFKKSNVVKFPHRAVVVDQAPEAGTGEVRIFSLVRRFGLVPGAAAAQIDQCTSHDEALEFWHGHAAWIRLDLAMQNVRPGTVEALMREYVTAVRVARGPRQPHWGAKNG